MSKDFHDWPIIYLPFERWAEIAPQVNAFGNVMPESDKRAGFLTMMNNDRVAGFVHVETLYHFAGVQVNAEYGANRAEMALELIRAASVSIPEGYSGIWLTDKRVDEIATLAAARLVQSETGTDRYYVYRRDR